jgi:Ca-activated chloride channel family protein
MKTTFKILLTVVLLNACGEKKSEESPDMMMDLSVPVEETILNTEEYNVIQENNFVEVLKNPLSTFSIDVDAASYSNTRRYISQGQLPPVDAVRIEELVNYFDYNYPEPQDSQPFSIYTEFSECPWNKEHQLLHIGLQGKKMKKEELPPNNLVFLLDVSGSMEDSNKLPLLKSSFHLLVEQLGKEDKIAIVVYAGSAGLVLPSTSCDQKDKIMQAINDLEASGSTAGAEGIIQAYQIAEENFQKNGNNRIILATDGDFNVGVSSEAELVRLIEKKRETGVFLSVLGFGTGNLKDAKMEQLADQGNGNYYYIDNLFEAQKVLVTEMGGTLNTIAKDVKIQVEFNPTKVYQYRLIGYENRALKNEDFENDAKDAGELGAGHSVTAIYEIVLKDKAVETATEVKYKYQTTQASPDAYANNELGIINLRYKEPDSDKSKLVEHKILNNQVSFDQTSNDFKFAAAVVEYGLILRASTYKNNASLNQVIKLAKLSKGEDQQGYREAFIKMVETTKAIYK